MTSEPGFWDRLGLDEAGMPKHLPMGVTADGQGPTNDSEAHHFVCWCGLSDCPLTKVLAQAHQQAWRSRPLRARVWFWRPQWCWHGWRTLLPFWTGGDEYDWHTIVLGWTVTGRVIIATRRCPQTGKCAGSEIGPDWPHGRYGSEDA